MALDRKHKMIIAVGTILIISPFGWDLFRKFTSTGIYRKQCRGTVIKTSRTLVGLIDVFDCSGSQSKRRQRRRMDRNYDHRGHYVAKIEDDSGDIYEVSISGRDYDRVQPGQYVVCRRSRRDVYPSKEAADKAAAAKGGPEHVP